MNFISLILFLVMEKNRKNRIIIKNKYRNIYKYIECQIISKKDYNNINNYIKKEY